MNITGLGSSPQFIPKALSKNNVEQKNLAPEKPQEAVELHPSVPQEELDALLPENREAYIKLSKELNEKLYFKGATFQDFIDNWELHCRLEVFIFSGDKKVLTEDDFKHVEKEAAEFKEKMAQIAAIKNYNPPSAANNTPRFVQQPSIYNSQPIKIAESNSQRTDVYKSITAQIIESYNKNSCLASSMGMMKSTQNILDKNIV